MNDEKRRCTTCYRWYTLQDISHALAAPEDSVCKGCSWGKFFYERYTKNTTVFPKTLSQYIYLRSYLYVLDERVAIFRASAYQDGGAEHRGVRQLVEDTERLMLGHLPIALARGYVYDSPQAAEFRSNFPNPDLSAQSPVWTDPTDGQGSGTSSQSVNPLTQLPPDFGSQWNVTWPGLSNLNPEAQPFSYRQHQFPYPYPQSAPLALAGYHPQPEHDIGYFQSPANSRQFPVNPLTTQIQQQGLQPYQSIPLNAFSSSHAVVSPNAPFSYSAFANSPATTAAITSNIYPKPYLTRRTTPPENDPNGPWYFHGGWWHNRPGPGQESPEEQELIRQRQKELQDRIDRQRERERRAAAAESEGYPQSTDVAFPSLPQFSGSSVGGSSVRSAGASDTSRNSSRGGRAAYRQYRGRASSGHGNEKRGYQG
ncbi:hypothetical protein QBC35DRAFT_42877 [Podospora australis]|uniref:Uncharacterized protein n=1 Tax=Podospora australis TaxID=1536484 RepID=A0AAN6X2I4_9PEZI|nr:hypothetical protein QBC35DRAFT_42877 [Podospora australis]